MSTLTTPAAPSPGDRSPSFAWPLIIVTAAAAALRIIGLDAGLWYDEIVTLVESARLPWIRIVTEFPDSNNHPLYSLLAHLSIVLFGEHAWSLRLPALVFGIASIPMIYLFGTTVSRRREALLAASLLAVSYHHIWFTQNARGYSALLFWTLLSTHAFVKLLGGSRTTWVVMYGAATALGIYTHLTMVFVTAAHTLIWAGRLWSRRGGNELRREVTTAALALGLGGIGAALLYGPVVTQVYQFFQAPSPETATTVATVATPGWAIAEVIRGLRLGWGAIGLVTAAAMGAAGLFSYWRERPIVAAMFVLPAFTTALGIVIMSAPARPRFFFSLLGFGLLLLVRGATTVASRIAVAAGRPGRAAFAGLVAVGLLIAISAASLPAAYRYPKQDFDSAVRFVRSRQLAGEPVATAGLASFPLTRYYNLPWTPVAGADELTTVRGGASRVWLVYSMPEYMDPMLVATMLRDCVLETQFPGTLGGGDVVIRTCAP
jgi:mannosyltransferase